MVGRWRLVVVVVLATLAAGACGDSTEDIPSDAGAAADSTDTTQADGGTLTAPDTLPTGVTAEMVVRGERLFKAGVCIACHGQDAGGTPIAPNLKDYEWLNTDGSYQGIQDIIRTGVPEPKQHAGAMQPMGGTKLTGEEIREIAAWIISIRGRS